MINNNVVERTSNFDFLGLVINETLSWNNHVDKVSNKISKYVGILCRLRHYLPPNIMRMIYCSMVQTHLNFSLLAWGFQTNRIYKLQKKIVRILCDAKYNAHTEPLFKSLSLLKIEDMFKMCCLEFYYKHCNGMLPPYFQAFNFDRQSDRHSYNTRHNSRLVVNPVRTQLAKRCVRHEVISVVNSTEKIILDKIHTHSAQGFKNYIKKYYLDKYSYACMLPNCYICHQ